MLTILEFVFDSETTNDGQVIIMGLFVLLLPVIIPLFLMSLCLLFSPIIIPIVIWDESGLGVGRTVWLIVIAIALVIFYFFGDSIIPFYSKVLHVLFIGK